MAGPIEVIEGCVLLREETGEQFDRITLLSPDAGVTRFLQRRTRKNPSLDLFDRVSATVERRNNSGSSFSREVRILGRAEGLGRHYECLSEACAFARILIDNPVHEDSRQTTAELLQRALEAWQRGNRADVVAFKCLFVFARDEGYAVREDWWSRLPLQQREQATRLLNNPAGEQALPADDVSRIRASLEHYLIHFTDITIRS